ncbi:hypothetical protein ACSX1A_11100 [Pontibacter sp. MBLB2868]
MVQQVPRLQRWGYIHYSPSDSYYQRNQVYLLDYQERKAIL